MGQLGLGKYIAYRATSFVWIGFPPFPKEVLNCCGASKLATAGALCCTKLATAKCARSYKSNGLMPAPLTSDKALSGVRPIRLRRLRQSTTGYVTIGSNPLRYNSGDSASRSSPPPKW